MSYHNQPNFLGRHPSSTNRDNSRKMLDDVKRSLKEISLHSQNSNDRTRSSRSPSLRKTGSRPWYLEISVIEAIFVHVESEDDKKAFSQVCKPWLSIYNQSKKSIVVKDWEFLESGRLFDRFPNLTDIDMTQASSSIISEDSSPPVLISSGSFRSRLKASRGESSDDTSTLIAFDWGMQLVAKSCPSLQRLALLDVCSQICSPVKRSKPSKSSQPPKPVVKAEEASRKDPEPVPEHLDGETEEFEGLGSVSGLEVIAENCHYLQELKLRQCSDSTLLSIGRFKNLHILHLAGTPAVGLKNVRTFTDDGLASLAANCQRLVELKLAAGSVGYEGLAAIGRSCQILSKLTLSTKMFKPGWLRALQHFHSLETFVLEGSSKIDSCPGPLESLGVCPSIARLYVQLSDLGDKTGLQALTHIVQGASQVEIKNCWRFSDTALSFFGRIKAMKSLALEGCSLITTAGLESLLKQCVNLEVLRVVYCEKVEDSNLPIGLRKRLEKMKVLTWQPKEGCQLLKSGTHFGFLASDPITTFANLQETVNANILRHFEPASASVLKHWPITRD